MWPSHVSSRWVRVHEKAADETQCSLWASGQRPWQGVVLVVGLCGVGEMWVSEGLRIFGPPLISSSLFLQLLTSFNVSLPLTEKENVDHATRKHVLTGGPLL